MDVLKAMEADSGIKLKELRVDGGACANNLLMQFQADLLGVPVVRPKGGRDHGAGRGVSRGTGGRLLEESGGHRAAMAGRQAIQAHHEAGGAETDREGVGAGTESREGDKFGTRTSGADPRGSPSSAHAITDCPRAGVRQLQLLRDRVLLPSPSDAIVVSRRRKWSRPLLHSRCESPTPKGPSWAPPADSLHSS